MNKLAIRLNESKNYNANLKETIDRYRQTRQTHNQLHEKLTKEYQSCQRDIEGILEKSSLLNENRELLTSQLEELVAEENKAIATFESQMGEHTAKIERQRANECMYCQTSTCTFGCFLFCLISNSNACV